MITPPLPRFRNLAKPEVVGSAIAALSIPGAVASLFVFTHPAVRYVAFTACLVVGGICISYIWSSVINPLVYRIRNFDEARRECSALEERLLDSTSLLSQLLGAEHKMEFPIAGGARRSTGFVIFLESAGHPFPKEGEHIHLVDPFTGDPNGIAVATSQIHNSKYLVATIDPARNQLMAGMIAEANGDSSKFITKSIGMVLVSYSPRPQRKDPQHV